MTPRLSPDFGDFAGRAWLNTAHQGAMPGVAAAAAQEAVSWKLDPRELTADRFEGVPRDLRAALARLVGADPDDVILANSASYGLHLVASAYPWAAGDEVLVMAGDFPSDILPWLVAERRFGVRVHRIRPGDHVVTPDELAAAITPRTRLFCVSWVHSFSGYVADLDGLGEVCRRPPRVAAPVQHQRRHRPPPGRGPLLPLSRRPGSTPARLQEEGGPVAGRGRADTPARRRRVDGALTCCLAWSAARS